MNEIYELLYRKTIGELLRQYPVIQDFLENYRLNNLDTSLSFSQAFPLVNEETLTDFGLTPLDLLDQLADFMEHFACDTNEIKPVSSITIIGGQDKSGQPENLELTISLGEVVSIVGPTGSGKSRLLEDIECLAQKDTPTRRQILLNHAPVPDETRFQMDGKLVAQLSQNMNFVMDLSVKEFLELHARCRLRSNYEEKINICFTCANELAGEKFTADTKVTQLSGGQSRALMIADTAFMSSSPIVLVDEIENAGINRKEAIALLAKKEKIVLLSTHDPLLALNADKRIVIKNGGISKLLTTSEEERESLVKIETLDETMQSIRESLRAGQRIHLY